MWDDKHDVCMVNTSTRQASAYGEAAFTGTQASGVDSYNINHARTYSDIDG